MRAAVLEEILPLNAVLGGHHYERRCRWKFGRDRGKVMRFCGEENNVLRADLGRAGGSSDLRYVHTPICRHLAERSLIGLEHFLV